MVRGYRRLSAKAIAPARVGLVRERLFTVAETRFGFALAPAGYGKTGLLAQVADTFDGAVCWYRADSADREPTLLMGKLGDALLRSLEITAEATSGSRSSESWRHPGQTVLLVVDDFHELEGSESEQSLASLIESAPGCLRILIAGRRWPALDIRQLRVSGESAVIEAADLQFRSWEVERLFRDVYGEPLNARRRRRADPPHRRLGGRIGHVPAADHGALPGGPAPGRGRARRRQPAGALIPGP